MAPGIRDLRGSARSAVAYHGAERVVIRKALISAICDVRKIGVVPAVHRIVYAVDDIRGRRMPCVRPLHGQIRIKIPCWPHLQARKIDLRTAVAKRGIYEDDV